MAQDAGNAGREHVSQKIDVAFRQEDAVAEGYGAVAVVDTLRATTTMTVLLERGALAVRPVADLEDAYAIKARDPEVLLGGERQNQPPEGFDGGNSPDDWPRSRINGRRVVFTTTNGTAAIERVCAIRRVVLASLLNAEACGQYLWALERPTLLVASGARHSVSLEDVVACGAVVSVWPRASRTDAAEIACALFEQERGRLLEALRTCDHGRDLVEMGLEQDLAFAAQLNTTRVVPVLCGDGWLRSAN